MSNEIFLQIIKIVFFFLKIIKVVFTSWIVLNKIYYEIFLYFNSKIIIYI